ncbi:MAG TPA: hypothetical protein VLF67_01060, partial [Candidatus Saccharimonas sp.]|nr:hypothetical protein [Candidatus Saccharimonas sp.]
TDPGALQIANNLSDLGDLTIAQTNLGLAPVALSGAYADLTGLPTISTVGHTGDYSDLIGAPALASVATSGSASDLGSGTLAAARLPQYTGGDVTTAGAGSVNLVIGALKVTTAMVQNSAITLAKMADMATASFLGRNTAGAGAPEVLSKATTKAMLDLTGVNSGDQTITLTGDVIGSGTGSFATTFKTNPVFTETITVNATTAGLACFNGNTQSGMMIGTRFSSDASGCTMRLMKARGTIASPATTVQNDESFRLIGRHYYSSSATVENFHLVSTLKTATPGVGDGESAFALKLCPAASATLTTFLSGDFATGLSLSSNVFIDANRHFKLRSYTVATVPSASVAGMLIYVSDGTSNKRLAVSDGTNWRWPDGAIVS